jgi:hypothetical protein
MTDFLSMAGVYENSGVSYHKYPHIQLRAGKKKFIPEP